MSDERVTDNVVWHPSSVTRADREGLLKQKGTIIWMTGLSGAGKSTIANLVEQRLMELGKLAYRLDGDNLRHGLNAGLGFSAADRSENVRRVGEVAKLFADAGMIVIVSLISPYRTDRDAIRASVGDGEFLEVHAHCSLSTAELRDPKGLYKKARAGQIAGFTGIDDPYEPPHNPELYIDTDQLSVDDAARQLVSSLQDRQRLM
jgi:adenylyl-sulfate kinase